jgi:hypothetical protein
MHWFKDRRLIDPGATNSSRLSTRTSLGLAYKVLYKYTVEVIN